MTAHGDSLPFLLRCRRLSRLGLPDELIVSYKVLRINVWCTLFWLLFALFLGELRKGERKFAQVSGVATGVIAAFLAGGGELARLVADGGSQIRGGGFE